MWHHGVMSRLFAAHVHHGVIVADGLDLPEGTLVTVVAGDDDDAYTPSEAELAELDLAIADADRGEAVPFEDVLADLDRMRPASAQG